MKPRRTFILLALLILLAVGAWLITGDRPLLLLARWRKATDNGERHTMDEMDGLFPEGGAK